MERERKERERMIRSDILHSFMCWTDHAVHSLTNLVYCFASFFLNIYARIFDFTLPHTFVVVCVRNEKCDYYVICVLCV